MMDSTVFWAWVVVETMGKESLICSLGQSANLSPNLPLPSICEGVKGSEDGYHTLKYYSQVAAKAGSKLVSESFGYLREEGLES